MNDKAALLIFIEPTPYILGLLERLSSRWSGRLQVLYVGTNVSQPWGELSTSVPVQLLPDSMLGQWRLLRTALATGQYQIVHLAGWSGAPAFKLAMLLAAWQGVPCTVESDTPSPWRQPWYKAALKRLFYPWLFRLPAHFFPGGSRQAAYLRLYGVAESRITVSRMTVDVAAMMARREGVEDTRRQQLRRALGCEAETCLFLYVGRLEPHKGLHELMEAFLHLEGSPAAAHLQIVGGGSLLEELRHKAATSARVSVSGRLAGDHLLDAYAAADVLVLPSRFEPWGLVVNEAMAAGLAVVVTDRVGCADDLVVEGKTGLVVRAESPVSLEQALRYLLDNPEMRRQMGLDARKLISGWTLEHEADIIVAVWDTLAGYA